MIVTKAYKGFNRDMTCRGFKYEEGGTYETESAKVCECGFHACENPIDCLGYCEAGSSVFHEVELDGKMEKAGDDTKVAATKIKIGARLSISALCEAAFEYVRSKCTNENNADKGEPATAGDSGAATARGSVRVGENGIGCVRGNGVKAMGGMGAILIIAVEDTFDYAIKEHATIVIDGNTYKPDTWYTVKNGKAVEVEGSHV